MQVGNPDVRGLKDTSGRREMDGPDAKHTNILFLLYTHSMGKHEKGEEGISEWEEKDEM